MIGSGSRFQGTTPSRPLMPNVVHNRARRDALEETITNSLAALRLMRLLASLRLDNT